MFPEEELIGELLLGVMSSGLGLPLSIWKLSERVGDAQGDLMGGEIRGWIWGRS